MDEDAPFPIRWPRVATRVVGYAILAVVLYALSVGPFIYFFSDRTLALNRVYARLYYPLHWLAAQSAWMRPVVLYEEWWRTLPGGPYERLLRQSAPLPAVNDSVL